MVPRENHDVAARLATDRVEILVNGIGRTPVPVFSDAHHRRQNLNKLPQLARKYLPSLANMAVEGKGLILRENKHPAQIRIDAVGESDINDTVDAAKRDGGLGAIASQRVKTLPLTSCQQAYQSVVCQGNTHRLKPRGRSQC